MIQACLEKILLFAYLLSPGDLCAQNVFNRIYNSADTVNDGGFSVSQTSDGGYILAGEAVTSFLKSEYYNGVYIIKVDSKGDTTWTRMYDLSLPYDSTGQDIGLSVLQLKEGNYLLAGATKDTLFSLQNAF